MRLFPALLLAACFSLPVMADSLEAEPASSEAIQATPGQQPGIYRFGATYSVTPSEDALSCQSACADNEMCKAWSFVAIVGETPARCELKRGGGKLERNPAATSGYSPTHEAFFSPVLEMPTDDLLGEDPKAETLRH